MVVVSVVSAVVVCVGVCCCRSFQKNERDGSTC
jgi:hypothetical protein